MTDSLLDRTFKVAFASTSIREEVEFLWHAGEPLTVGTQYYANALSHIDRHNTRDLRVVNNIQTNATLINDAWATFLVEHNFSVGVSIDGPARIHDNQRRRWSGAGSHAATMRGVQFLRNHSINPGVICVLTRESLSQPDEMFEFFLSNGFQSLGFNVEEIENAHTTSSLSQAGVVREYREFMERLFIAWWPHRERIRIREFDDFARVFREYSENPSWHRRVLETEPLGIVTVQRNGDVSTFSPEFAGAKSREFGSFVIGNIWKIESFDELAEGRRFKAIAREAEFSVGMCRSSCEFFPVCGGEFLSNKFSEHGTLRATETITCRLHRKVLATVLLDKLAQDSPCDGEQWSSSSAATHNPVK
jgi:uncharacterized protein